MQIILRVYNGFELLNVLRGIYDSNRACINLNTCTFRDMACIAYM